MRRIKGVISLVAAVLLCAFAASAAFAVGADIVVQAKFDQLLAGLSRGDKDLFVKDTSETFQKEMTQEKFDQVHQLLATEAKKGFSHSYFGSLDRHGYQVHLWKIVFKEESNDVLAKMVLKNGIVEGFWLE